MKEKELTDLADKFVTEQMSARDEEEKHFGKECYIKGFEAGYSYYIDLELKHLYDELHNIKKAQETTNFLKKTTKYNKMMKNIFENAYFGKIYKTRNGEKCIYLRSFVRNDNYYSHLVSNGSLEYAVNEAGLVDFHIYNYGYDIISELEESIDEKKLDKLAEDASYEAYQTDEYDNPSLRQGYYRGFKDGYRKEKGL